MPPWTETEFSASLSERDRHTISVCFFRVVILLNKTVHLQLTKTQTEISIEPCSIPTADATFYKALSDKALSAVHEDAVLAGSP